MLLLGYFIVLLITTSNSVFYEVTQHCVLVNLNGHMHLDSLGSSICIWVRDDETHTQLRIGQNTSAYACAHMHTCCAHMQMCFGQSPNAYACAHMHMSSKRIWSITYDQSSIHLHSHTLSDDRQLIRQERKETWYVSKRGPALRFESIVSIVAAVLISYLCSY